MKEVEVLDLAQADRLMLSYKRGLITRRNLKRKLAECGVPEHLLDQAILETDVYPLAELEWRVEHPGEGEREEIQIAVEQCPECKGERMVKNTFGGRDPRMCLRCCGLGYIVTSVKAA
jgi:hypothetical protein